MEANQMERLRQAVLAPYIQLATALVGKPRRCGGNMFRHQMDTLSILIDYGHVDHALLKAAVIHDLIEDDPDLQVTAVESLPDGPEVLALVREVSRTPEESKIEFLLRVRRQGSPRAKLLKVADRLSNMISLGLVNDWAFVKRYLLETSFYVYPIADEIDQNMAREMRDLIASRLDLLSRLPRPTELPGDE